MKTLIVQVTDAIVAWLEDNTDFGSWDEKVKADTHAAIEKTINDTIWRVVTTRG